MGRSNVWISEVLVYEEMKLFKVTLNGMNYGRSTGSVVNGTAYVVAEDLTTAYNKVRKYMDKNDLGFTHEREVESIELLAEEADYPDCGYRLYL